MSKLQSLNNIFNYLRVVGEVKTQKDFAKYIGVCEATMSSAMNGNERFLTDGLLRRAESAKMRYDIDHGNVKTSDLVDGYNKPLTEQKPAMLHDSAGESHAVMIPTVPYKVYQETGVNLLEYLERPELPRSRNISQFAKADCHLFVATDEMHPHMKPGDVLALKAVPDEAPIVNGEIYVVNSQYLGITIRQVYNRGDHYEMRSSQSKYEAFDIPKSQVYCMFRVLGLVRTNIQ
ncbi:MAG: S24/S26 family peptidase [Bacteroidales bacterium]|nr:S24/S26 family peptidase [Candidatus Colicola equi]